MSDIDEKIANLRKLVALMREGGVKRYRDGELEVELYPSAPMTGLAAPEDLGGPELCLCGHEKEAEHSDFGLCLHGCDAGRCRPETKKE